LHFSWCCLPCFASFGLWTCCPPSFGPLDALLRSMHARRASSWLCHRYHLGRPMRQG
jgi:hypothetical protein